MNVLAAAATYRQKRIGGGTITKDSVCIETRSLEPGMAELTNHTFRPRLFPLESETITVDRVDLEAETASKAPTFVDMNMPRKRKWIGGGRRH